MEMGINPQIGFTEMNKDRNVENGIGSKMAKLDLIEIKKASEEIRGWDSKIAFIERSKYRDFLGFFEWALMIQGIPPLAYVLGEKSFLL